MLSIQALFSFLLVQQVTDSGYIKVFVHVIENIVL